MIITSLLLPLSAFSFFSISASLRGWPVGPLLDLIFYMRCRNDIVFENVNYSSIMQTIFSGMYWLRFWLCCSVMGQRKSSIQRAFLWRSLSWRSSQVVGDNLIIDFVFDFCFLISASELKKYNKFKLKMLRAEPPEIIFFSKKSVSLRGGARLYPIFQDTPMI